MESHRLEFHEKQQAEVDYICTTCSKSFVTENSLNYRIYPEFRSVLDGALCDEAFVLSSITPVKDERLESPTSQVATAITAGLRNIAVMHLSQRLAPEVDPYFGTSCEEQNHRC
ncbi:hypothetical protein PT974_03250 [Cladobotryum mycophilum]|uniref:Uncharacterized protein n=1 Tax=Cladobotryum mycophilum TaxID=491253 RepID=A0ABR0SS37_9HYPO